MLCNETIYLSLEKRYDGTLYSLSDKSHKPHSHPNQHTQQELKLISDMRRRNPHSGYVPKPSEKMLFPGQRVQIDVKFVPSCCLVGETKNQKFYQYTALDEHSRFRYVEVFKEHSSYSSAVFLEHLIKAFPFPIHCVQIDNGQEFTKRL